MRPPACGAARDTPADNYGRKQKPTAKKTRKTRQKTKKTLKNPRKKRYVKTPNKGRNNGGGGVACAGYASCVGRRFER
jgi:ssDNA-binding Zn-finger/Zn-ribbon topoisomerase 1